jgi:hypothetical protein
MLRLGFYLIMNSGLLGGILAKRIDLGYMLGLLTRDRCRDLLQKIRVLRSGNSLGLGSSNVGKGGAFDDLGLYGGRRVNGETLALVNRETCWSSGSMCIGLPMIQMARRLRGWGRTVWSNCTGRSNLCVSSFSLG